MKTPTQILKIAAASVLLLLTTVAATAQSETTTTEQIEALMSRLEAIEKERATEAEAAKTKSFYAPQLNGAILAYFNVNTYDGDQRFAVRSAHLSVRGNASTNMSYYIHWDCNNLTSFKMLDTYIRYVSERKNFNLTLGQQWIYITSDYTRNGPKSSIFTSRSLGVVYLANYTNGSAIKSFGIRDIGLYANYTFDTATPVTLSLGAFNGAGSNSLEWDNDINLTGRIQVGDTKGLSGGASIYGGTTMYEQKVIIASAEVRYITENLFVEGNYQYKRVGGEPTIGKVAQSGLIQGYYTIKTPNNRLFASFAPTARYDFGRGMLYTNPDSGVAEQNASRLTTQISFMMNGAKIRSRLSIGFEKIFMSDKPSDYAENTLFQDRFTVGMTVAF
ncbi:MAG: porin [Rikenellaceae bacterium]